MKNKITLVIAFSMTLFISTNLFAQVVTSSADDGTDGTLRNEIADTPAGGTITFDAGITTVTLNSELLITKELTIDGSSVTIDANSNGRVFHITAGPLELNGLTLTNGLEIDGGAIYMTNTEVTINNSIITNNVANGTSGSGGGIFNDVGGVLVVNDSEISYNTANRAGGGIEDNSGVGLAITLNNVNLDNNNTGVAPATAAPGNGGGLHITGAGDALISGGTVTENTAAKEGGGLWNGTGIMTVSGTAITGNSAVGDATGGGGIFNNGGTVNVNNTTTLSGNIAMGATPGGRGGAIFNNTDGILNLDNGLEITGNYASRAGGAIEDNSNGTLILAHVTLTGNAAGVDIGLGNTVTPNPGNGGAVHLSGTTNASITTATIEDNLAASEGGGLWNNLGTMNIYSAGIRDNIASGDAADNGGGGIFNNGGTLFVGSGATILNNIANGAAGSGGGIFSTDGDVTIDASWVAYNMSNRAGGGIELIEGTLSIVDTTLDYNSTASAPGNGGGLHITGAANSTITNGTVTGNIASREGGGLWNGTGTMTVDGAIIDTNDAQGPAADDGGGGIFNNGGTLIVLPGTTITNNTASGALGSGGGIFSLTPGTLDIDGLTINNNTANRAGGGIEINSASGETYTFNNVNLDSNSVNGPAPGNGGGFHISGMGNVVYNGGAVTNNSAFEGGGLWNSVGSMEINGTTITGNIANGDATGGGGLFNNGGTLNVGANTTLTGNMAMGATPGGRGGAIFNSTDGILNLADGLAITGNYASRAGGAIEDNSNGTLILSGVTLTGNSAGVAIGLENTITPNPGNGGAVHLSGTTNATVSGFSTISNNYAAKEGGGLWNNMGTMNVSATFLDGNIASGDDADDGGGAIFNNGGTLIVGNTAAIINNIADGIAGSGGAILSTNGAVTITDAVLAFNQSNRAGGAIEIIDGSIEFSGNFNISDNNTGVAPAVASPGNGGALHISGSATAMIIGGTMNNNIAAREGGALWNSTATMTVDGTMIASNIASGPAADDGGAGIFNNGGTLIVQNGTVITNNVADGTSGSGGGLLSIGGAVIVEDASITNNRANRAGGGIELADGTLDLSSTDLSNNNAGVSPAIAAPGNGGGLHLGGLATATIAFSTVRDNYAVEGGGLWNGGSDMTVTTSEISGNSANEGGGVYNETGAASTIMTSTISGNVASVSGGGLTNNGLSLELNAVTVAMNETPGNGGGIDAVNSVDLKNTIVALNSATSGTDVSGTLNSNDYNLIGVDDLNVFTLQTNDIVGVDPMLGPLQDNGGTTFTHQLLDDSLAFDAGDSADIFVDQIGQVVFGSARDIGAFEAQVTLSLEDFNSESVLNMFPNPTNGQFNIVIDNSISGNVNVQIVSMTGKLIKQLSLSNGNNAMDISGMSSGIYIVNVITNRGRTSHKLILE